VNDWMWGYKYENHVFFFFIKKSLCEYWNVLINVLCALLFVSFNQRPLQCFIKSFHLYSYFCVIWHFLSHIVSKVNLILLTQTSSLTLGAWLKNQPQPTFHPCLARTTYGPISCPLVYTGKKLNKLKFDIIILNRHWMKMQKCK